LCVFVCLCVCMNTHTHTHTHTLTHTHTHTRTRTRTRIQVVMQLVSQDEVNPNEANNLGQTALHQAVQLGHLQACS